MLESFTSNLTDLKIQPENILSLDQFHDLMQQQEGCYLGDVSIPPLQQFNDFMHSWTTKIDGILNQVEPYTPIYFIYFTNRGFTYDEYRLLFKEIPEENFPHYPIFEFLRIPSRNALIEFRLALEDTMEDYFQLLRQTLENTERLGITFFLRQLKANIPLGELQKHCYICGATGSGKSELMRLLFFQLQKSSAEHSSRSLILIDPHGDLCDQVKNSILNKDSRRLIHIEPDLRVGWSPVINPLELKSRNENAVVARAQFLSEAIEEAVQVDLSANMSAILIPALSLLLRLDGTTLVDLIKLMRNDKALIEKGKRVPNPAHRVIFENWHDPHYNKTKAAVYTKLQSFLNYPAFYNLIIGKSTIDLGKAINGGKVITFNLSQRFFGVEASKSFGRFMISMIKSHVLVRKEFRKPTYLFVDECQNFITESIQNIIEQTRKYGLHIIMANQSIERLGKLEEVALGNTSVKIIGKNDSIKTANKIKNITGISTKVLQSIRNFHFLLKTSSMSPRIFKSSDVLLLDRRLELQDQDLQLLHNRMVEDYYRKVEVEMRAMKQKEETPLFDL